MRRVRQGLLVDEEKLAFEVIAEVMDSGRSFMGQKHTRKHLRQGRIWHGRLAPREVSWDSWRKLDSPDVLDRSQAEAERILAEHQVAPLPEEQERELHEILRTARA